MSTDSPVSRCIAEAEQRLGAIEVLCSIIVGQARAERKQLDELKIVLAPAAPGHQDGGQLAPGDTSLALLEG